MPGSVAAAAPTLVLPYSLAIAFQQERVYLAEENVYAGGELQNRVRVVTSRKRWPQVKRLTTADLVALRAFQVTVGQGEFYFYDVYETSPAFSYDATGASAIGRYAVRFEGELSWSLLIPRHELHLQLVEVS